MEHTPEQQQEAVNQLYNYAANMMVTQNKTAWETRQSLVEQGLNENAAQTVVDNIDDQIKAAKRKRGNKDMLYGGLWCAGGTIITIATYSAASEGGGHYVVAWGAIIFGAIQFFRGVANSI
ncbi:hypothetical protein [Ferruginibacter sp.]